MTEDSKDEKSSAVQKTAAVKFSIDELMTLLQVLRTYELHGPAEQLAMVIPRFETLKQKVSQALDALRGAEVKIKS